MLVILTDFVADAKGRALNLKASAVRGEEESIYLDDLPKTTHIGTSANVVCDDEEHKHDFDVGEGGKGNPDDCVPHIELCDCAAATDAAPPTVVAKGPENDDTRVDEE